MKGKFGKVNKWLKNREKKEWHMHEESLETTEDQYARKGNKKLADDAKWYSVMRKVGMKKWKGGMEKIRIDFLTVDDSFSMFRKLAALMISISYGASIFVWIFSSVKVFFFFILCFFFLQGFQKI